MTPDRMMQAFRALVDDIAYTRICPECRRSFDMAVETDAQEWHYGHDCEETATDG